MMVTMGEERAAPLFRAVENFSGPLLTSRRSRWARPAFWASIFMVRSCSVPRRKNHQARAHPGPAPPIREPI